MMFEHLKAHLILLKQKGKTHKGAASFISPPSGRALVIPIFSFVLFLGHLPQTSGLRYTKQILVASSATQARARILSDVIYFVP